jgi:hypothetical protein
MGLTGGYAYLQIAVITPYNAQVQLLRTAFEAQPEIEIGSGVSWAGVAGGLNWLQGQTCH